MLLASAEAVAGIGAGATLLAAGSAVWVSIRMTDARLAAAATRQAEELRHARELADLADLRQLFDAMAISLLDGAGALAGLGRLFDEDRGDAEVRRKDAKEIARSITNVSETLLGLSARLGIRRIARDDPVEMALNKARSALLGIGVWLTSGTWLKYEDRIWGCVDQFHDAQRTFNTAAVDIVGSAVYQAKRSGISDDVRGPLFPMSERAALEKASHQATWAETGRTSPRLVGLHGEPHTAGNMQADAAI
jgi:hypothetical protein